MKIKPKKSLLKAKPKELSVCTTSAEKTTEYEEDFVGWAEDQVNLLKEHNFPNLDVANLIQEIESLGKTDRRALKSHIVNLLMHLLKVEYQPQMQKNSSSWQASIINAQLEIRYLLEDSPSLIHDLKNISIAYEDAKEIAAKQTGLKITVFPKECPWKLKEILPFIVEKKLKTQKTKKYLSERQQK